MGRCIDLPRPDGPGASSSVDGISASISESLSLELENKIFFISNTKNTSRFQDDLREELHAYSP